MKERSSLTLTATSSSPPYKFIWPHLEIEPGAQNTSNGLGLFKPSSPSRVVRSSRSFSPSEVKVAAALAGGRGAEADGNMAMAGAGSTAFGAGAVALDVSESYRAAVPGISRRCAGMMMPSPKAALLSIGRSPVIAARALSAGSGLTARKGATLRYLTSKYDCASAAIDRTTCRAPGAFVQLKACRPGDSWMPKYWPGPQLTIFLPST